MKAIRWWSIRSVLPPRGPSIIGARHDQLHVIEHYRLTDDGKVMEVQITMEDTIAFTAPWVVMQKYHRVQDEPPSESICAENNTNYFNLNVTPIPQADTPEF